jgi:Spy/CpxP family protein refolding chaperone
MKKLLILTALIALAPTASYVYAAPDTAQRPAITLEQAWKCQCEDQAKQNSALKAAEDEAVKILKAATDKKRQ